MTLVPSPPPDVAESSAAWEHSLALSLVHLVDADQAAVDQLLAQVCSVDAGRAVARCLLAVADALLAAVPRDYRELALSAALCRTIPDRIEEFE